MEEQTMIQSIKPCQQKTIIQQACENLWKSCFEDSDRYVSWYFQEKWKKSVTVLLSSEENAPYSMLHLNPYVIVMEGKEVPLYYVVGVATHQAQRRKGYMGRVLQKAFQELYSQKCPFVYLMPARKEIYEPYDFQVIYQAFRRRWCLEAEACSEPSYTFVNYEEAELSEKDKLVELAQNLLSQQFQMFAKRDLAYFDEIAGEMEACRGELLLVYQGEELMGCLEYGMEDGDVEIFENMGYQKETILRDSFGTYLCRKTGCSDRKCQINEDAFLTDGKECVSGREKSHAIMARILDFETGAAFLRCRERTVMKLEITDQWIKENNGKWQLIADRDHCEVYRLSDESVAERQLTIGEFCREMFYEKKVYLNELV